MATLVYNNRPSLRPARMFNSLLSDMLRETGGTQPAPSFVPAADIVETAQGFELHLALPGVKKEAVKIEFLDGQLRVSGERVNPFTAAKEAAATAAEATDAPTDETKPAVVPAATEAAPRYRRTETNFGHFQRSFRLPDTVNVKGIGAELTDGILRVTLPFDTEKVTKQTIEVR
jgi:HSP20 family protein